MDFKDKANENTISTVDSADQALIAHYKVFLGAHAYVL